MTYQSTIDFPDARKGYRCPCCASFIKEYSRPLNSSMAYVLLLLVSTGRLGWVHIEKWLKEIGKPELRADYHKLRFFGLLEANDEKKEDGNPCNGFYKITGRGIAFASGNLTVPKRVIIRNNKFLGFEGDEVDIKQALGTKFNYEQLLNS